MAEMYGGICIGDAEAEEECNMLECPGNMSIPRYFNSCVVTIHV